MSGGKTKFAIFSAFLVALVGGGAVGLLISRYVVVPNKPAQSVSVGQSLSEQLQLNPEQEENIRKIWEQMRDQSQKAYLDADAVNHDRDAAIEKLLDAGQKKQFHEIQQDYQDRYTKVLALRDAAFNDAVAKTKQLLNASQRKRYEAILAERMGQKTAAPDGLTPERPARSTSSFTSSSTALESPG